METKVLVAYATKHGATAEIAKRIGTVLNESPDTGAGLHADVLPADQVEDLSPYAAVVLGSAVYMGRWRKPAADLLRKREAELAQKEVWLFSSGPTNTGDVEELMEGWYFPKNLQETADRIGPNDIAVFHGEMDPDKLNFWEKWIIKNVKAPTGDFRDWDAISAWALGIAKELQGEEATEETEESDSQ